MTQRRPLALLAVLAVVLGVAVQQGTFTPEPDAPGPLLPTEDFGLAIDVLTDQLDAPWAVAFLPDGRFLVTQRGGTLRLIDADGGLSAPLSGLPPVAAIGQGGLLDVALAPDFATTGALYFTFAEPGDGGLAGTALGRARLQDQRLEDARVLWRQEPKLPGGQHFGSRVVVARDGTLFVTTGERDHRAFAQSLAHTQGKVVRLAADGSPAAGNPFVADPLARPEIWSLGHRNIQGAALHPLTGELWITEHGPQGGDEVNLSRAGRNYGWPVVCSGREYGGGPINEGLDWVPGVERSVHFWAPSIAPSGLAFVTADTFPRWKGSLLAGGLAGRVLVRLTLAGDWVVDEERLLTTLNQRIRDVREGPDGFLYVLTDGAHGQLLRLRPVQPPRR